MIRRPPRSTPLYSSAASDVYKRQNLAGFIAKLFETHPAIAQVAGVMGILGGVFWALMAPIVAISSVLTNVFGLSLFSVTEKILDFVRTSSLVTGATEALIGCLLYTSPSPRDMRRSRMPSSA
ncbi:hypothetical protein JMUB7524_27190 [Staphylococcus aureus]